MLSDSLQKLGVLAHKKAFLVTPHTHDAVFEFSQNDHALRHVYALSNLCEENIPAEM